MEELKNQLKTCLKNYRDIDDKVREVNKVAYELREKRKIVEFEMADILKSQHLSQINMLKLENDNSTIKIQRPGTYSRTWYLSKKDLENYINHYFENAGNNANRKDCFDFIVSQQKLDNVETDFKFVRTIPNENLTNE